jgi:hypothetical protein
MADKGKTRREGHITTKIMESREQRIENRIENREFLKIIAAIRVQMHFSSFPSHIAE